MFRSSLSSRVGFLTKIVLLNNVSRLISQASSKHVALVMNGCGVFDGTEVTEATSLRIHLDKAGVKMSVFAPNIKQTRVVNHASGAEVKETRNALVEAARITRGSVLPLDKLDCAEFDALLFPGGFGVATTLSDFAASGSSCKVLPDVDRVIKEFVKSKKPIGLCCIAPVLAARCIPGVTITMGKETDEGGRWQNAGACVAVKEMGVRHEPKDITEICVDEKNKVVTCPAFMCSTASITEVFDNIGLLVAKVVSMIR